MENQTNVDELSYREASTELEHIIRQAELFIRVCRGCAGLGRLR